MEETKMKINTALYLDTIKNTINTDGWKVADIMNKMSLEKKAITIAQYSAAARLIAAAFLNN